MEQQSPDFMTLDSLIKPCISRVFNDNHHKLMAVEADKDFGKCKENLQSINETL